MEDRQKRRCRLKVIQLVKGRQKDRSRDFFPTHPTSLPRGGEAWGGQDVEFFTLLDSTVPSPSWALTRRAGWGAPGAHGALLGAPCPVGLARGPGTGPGWEAVLRFHGMEDGVAQPGAMGGACWRGGGFGHRGRGLRIGGGRCVAVSEISELGRGQGLDVWGIPPYSVCQGHERKRKRFPDLSHPAMAAWPGRLEVLHFWNCRGSDRRTGNEARVKQPWFSDW